MARILALLLSLGLLVAQAPLAWGADPAASLDDHAKAVNRAARTPEGGPRVVEHLSQELNVPAATLRAQREQSKLGWGELSIAYRLSQKTGVPVNQLIAEHKSGKGWGAIAKAHNVSLGPLVSEVKKSDQALEARAKKGDRPDETGGRGAGQAGGGQGAGRGHAGGRGK